ncbi:HAMP domain-containing sensor histidine kinase [Xanthomonas sp. 3075]|uniref:sensor histidine kinase n=1 Tax=Xanthomonas sp. 3075 TaxID=3035315 RepID=UPI001609D21B|nr:HAMP domain-containing sensor histidine kinase [Xanthomonas sp. 3075]
MAGLAAGMAAIFVADTITDYAVAAALFYTLVVLLSVRLLTRTGVVALAATCLALIVLSFHLTPAGSYRVGVINSCISAVVVAVTTYLAVQMEAAKASAHAAQARLLRLTRSGSMGGLAASIAHEVNQPLAAIVTSGNACQRWLAQQPPNLAKADAAVERMLADAGRASAIIARMRALARGEASQRQPMELNRTLLEMIALTRGETERNGIALSLELDPTLPAVLADRVQIQQVIGNVLLNAVEALATMPDETRSIHVRSHIDGAWVCLRIEDSGPGLSDEALAHVFDAFWSTKDDGMGIGLSISRTIMEANGGQIWAEPAGARGARFGLRLPLVNTEHNA